MLLSPFRSSTNGDRWTLELGKWLVTKVTSAYYNKELPMSNKIKVYHISSSWRCNTRRWWRQRLGWEVKGIGSMHTVRALWLPKWRGKSLGLSFPNSLGLSIFLNLLCMHESNKASRTVHNRLFLENKHVLWMVPVKWQENWQSAGYEIWIKVKYSHTRSRREVNGDCVKELIA